MPKGRAKQETYFHRAQIGRAQRYIRVNFGEKLTLTGVAKEAGASSYHFARLFLAFTGETPFEFLRRIRLAAALRMLYEDPDGPVTEIALSVGYDTPSAFNKVFKKTLNLSPRDFRNLGKEAQYDVIYHLTRPRIQKEITMNLNLEFDVVTRPFVHYVFVEKQGPFAEVAPPAWNEFFSLTGGQLDQAAIAEYLGLSTIDKTKLGEEAMIYQAGVGMSTRPDKLPRGVRLKQVASGRYARFLLTGPYPQIWPAFNEVFKTLADRRVQLRDEFCIENYLNDPRVTPEDQLLTELLVPVG